MKKKVLSIILVGALVASLGALAGCNSSSESKEEKEEEKDEEKAEKDEEKAEKEEEKAEEEEEKANEAEEKVDEATGTTESAGDEELASVTSDDIAGAEYQLQLCCTTADYDVFNGFPERVYLYSDGQVGITLMDIDSLGTATDALEMVKNGTVAIYFNGVAQTAESFPVSDLFTVPFMFQSAEQQNKTVYALYDAGYLTEFDDNITPLWFSYTDPQMILFASKEPTTTDDLKGLQIRATSGLSVTMLENLGASVVSMGTSDVYLALDRGVVDGAISSPTMMASRSWQDVSKYLMNKDFFYGVEVCAINTNLLESMPTECQDAIKKASEEQYEFNLEWVGIAGDNALQELQDAGVELYEVSDELNEAFEEQEELLKQEQTEDLTSKGFDGEAIMKIVDETIEANPVN